MKIDGEVAKKSKGLLKTINRVDNFRRRFGEYPAEETLRVIQDLRYFSDTLANFDSPENEEELIESELKRRFDGEASVLEHNMGDRYCDFDKIISIYGISNVDIKELRPWLEERKESVQKSIERLFQSTDTERCELFLPVDIPSVRTQAEGVGEVYIEKYHVAIGELLQKITNIGHFLRDIRAKPTTQGRSYFNPLTKTLAIGLPAICFSREDGILEIRDSDLIRLYGHEGMGHALNHVITKSDGLPYFLTKSSSISVATEESIAQFYQNVIWDDLKKSPQTQERLGIRHKFDRMHQEAKDTRELEEYRSRLSHYALVVLADKSLGNPESLTVMNKKAEILKGVSLAGDSPSYYLERHRRSFDSKGNLPIESLSEIRYCARPVERALKEFEKNRMFYSGENRSKIDMTLLRGFWTPEGFVDNARIIAEAV